MKVAILCSSIRNHLLSDWCRNSKENAQFWDNNFNNFKQSNEWHNEIVQTLEDSDIFLKGVTKTIKNETKEDKIRFLSMLLGTLSAILLGNVLSGKGIIKELYWFWKQKRKKNGKSLLWKRMRFLLLAHLLTNFEIQMYYQNRRNLMEFFQENICLRT